MSHLRLWRVPYTRSNILNGELIAVRIAHQSHRLPECFQLGEIA